MRKLVVGTFLTVDGVMQAPGGPDEDREGGFEHGGWSFNYWDDVMGPIIDEFTNRADGLLLGRKTYEIFAGYWPKQTEPDDAVAGPLNRLPKYVASTTLERVDWNNSTLLSGDVAQAVAELKKADGRELQVHGSGNLLQTLIANDLVDEFRVWTYPLLLGDGKKLFASGTVPTAFRVIDTKSTPTGVVVNCYERVGKPNFLDIT